jgi:Flp pilus assembly pilin Flp
MLEFRFMSLANNSRCGRRGATLIEYAVLAGLVMLALATAIMVAGQRTARSYDPSGKADVTVQPQELPADK